MNLRSLGLPFDAAQIARRESPGAAGDTGGAVFSLDVGGAPSPSARASAERTRTETPSHGEPRRPALDEAVSTPGVTDERSRLRAERRHEVSREANETRVERDDAGPPKAPAEPAERAQAAAPAREELDAQGAPRDVAAQARAVQEPPRDAAASTHRAGTSGDQAVTRAAEPMDSSVATSVLAQLALQRSTAAPAVTPASVTAPLDAAAWQPATSTTPSTSRDAPRAISLPGAPPSTVPLDAFAALAALAGKSRGEHASPGGTDTAGAAAFDSLLQKLDAPPPGVTIPGTPMRVAETGTAVAVLGTVALPATPDAGFDDSFDQRIAWMADQRITQAEMRVSPEGAGPIDVRLQIEGHRVTAQFNAANADVRQALEAGMDRLRDLLGQRGMELADAHVGRQGTQRDPRGTPGGGHGPDGEVTDGVTTMVGPLLRSRGLVDEYA